MWIVILPARSIIEWSSANHVYLRHALATLEIGNLSCIPVHKGADYPILNTPELFQTVSQVMWCS
jgi:inosine-uridine nucleoside N-ribohydrolase